MILAILNQKGGVGKTTTALNLAAALAKANKRVVMIDLDQQQDLSSFVAPDVTNLSATARTLNSALKTPFDFALLDCPPALGPETAAALKVAHLALVPVNTEYSALRGLSRLMDTVAAARAGGNPTLRLKILLTMMDVRAGHCRDIEREAGELLGSDLLKARIRRSYAFADAAQAGETIFEHAPRSRGAQAYRELAQEILAL